MSCYLVVRSYCARRTVAKLKDKATVELVTMENMMESIVKSNLWVRQCELNETDMLTTKHQQHLVEAMMIQVVHQDTGCHSGYNCTGDSKWSRIL